MLRDVSVNVSDLLGIGRISSWSGTGGSIVISDDGFHEETIAVVGLIPGGKSSFSSSASHSFLFFPFLLCFDFPLEF